MTGAQEYFILLKSPLSAERWEDNLSNLSEKELKTLVVTEINSKLNVDVRYL